MMAIAGGIYINQDMHVIQNEIKTTVIIIIFFFLYNMDIHYYNDFTKRKQNLIKIKTKQNQ